MEDVLILLQKSSGASIFAIGDDDQDIMGFTRRKIGDTNTGCDYFHRFCNRYALAESHQLALRINFRSGYEVVNKSQSLISNFFANKNNLKRWKDHLRVELNASNLDDAGQIEIKENHQSLITQLPDLVRDAAANKRSIAILCRTNNEVIEIVQMLDAHGLQMEMRTSVTYPIGRLRHFGSFFDICRTLLDLDLDLLLTNSLQDYLIKEWRKQNIPEARNPNPPLGTPSDLIKLTLNQNRFARLSSLLDFEYMKTDELMRILGHDNKLSKLVSTIHKVKGLEFDDVVIIPSTSEYPFNGGSQSDEVYTYYVAMTRAKKKLVYSWGEREKAWWKGNSYPDETHKNNARANIKQRLRTILCGSQEEIDISWAAKRARQTTLQSYIETNVNIGDIIEVEEKQLFHQGPTGRKQIGKLSEKISKKIGADNHDSIQVVAVYRYPQKENEHWHTLSDKVQQRRWSYVVLVAGIL